MPRQRVVSPDEAEATVDIRLGRKGPGRPKKSESDDPRPSIPGGDIVKAKKIQQDQAGSDRYSVYVRNLVATSGNIVESVALAYGISEEEATKNLPALHSELRSFSRAGLTLSELLERHDLTREIRLAVLREALFSPIPAVRLKAVEMLDEVDLTAKASRIGNTWEDIVRIAQERASRKKSLKR